MKKVLITGGLGFIGSNLARKCVDFGEEVTILSKSTRKIKNIKGIEDKVNLIIKPVKDILEEVDSKDVIYHLAGSTDNYSIVEGTPYKDIELNCISTIALLEACKIRNPRTRIIFASTFFVNGNQETFPVTPNSPCNPLGLYGATRLAAEHFCKIYQNIFDLNLIISRFTNVFGVPEAGDDRKKAGFNHLINLGVHGQDIPLYNGGDFFRDYIYVSDVVDACHLLSEKGQNGLIYYVGRGEFVKFGDLVQLIVKNVGGRIKPVESPDFHKRVGITNFVSDVSALKSLGWSPKISLEEGIKKTAEFYRQNG